MGFGQRSNSTFFNIIDGKFAVRVQKETPGAVARTNKNGEVVYEIHHDNISARLENISIREGDYGKEWIVRLADVDEKYTLQISYSSRFAKSFLFCLPKIDLNKEVTLTPYQTIKNDKKQSVMFVNQDGEAIKWAYTKDTPNGLPPMEKIMVKGVETWDDSKQLLFLEAMVKEKFADQEEIPQKTKEQLVNNDILKETDDLPF